MTAPAPSERKFEKLHHAVHTRVPFSTVKISHSLCTVFKGSVYKRLDQRRVEAEFEVNGEKSCPKTGGTAEVIVDGHGHESVDVYLALPGVRSEHNSGWRRVMRSVQLMSITDSVEELCESCFSECKSLSRVTFGESSSLKLIGKRAFYRSGLVEIHIPDGVEELCESCFCDCKSLSRVTFGELSSLKLIGTWAFRWSGLVEIHIPDSVEELCNCCFSECKSLSRVTFGESSSLKLIGNEPFYRSGVVEIHIPERMKKLLRNEVVGSVLIVEPLHRE